MTGAPDDSGPIGEKGTKLNGLTLSSSTVSCFILATMMGMTGPLATPTSFPGSLSTASQSEEAGERDPGNELVTTLALHAMT